MPTFVASSPRAVVLLSGGLDSYTAGAMAARDGCELYALTVRYGQVHAREVEAARRVAAALGVRRHIELDVDLAAWILDARLPVRLQLQQHKYIWEPAARRV